MNAKSEWRLKKQKVGAQIDELRKNWWFTSGILKKQVEPVEVPCWTVEAAFKWQNRTKWWMSISETFQKLTIWHMCESCQSSRSWDLQELYQCLTGLACFTSLEKLFGCEVKHPQEKTVKSSCLCYTQTTPEDNIWPKELIFSSPWPEVWVHYSSYSKIHERQKFSKINQIFPPLLRVKHFDLLTWSGITPWEVLSLKHSEIAEELRRFTSHSKTTELIDSMCL